MTAWVPVSRPVVNIVAVVPTLDLVRSCGLGHCPGVRLTANHLAVEDSLGFLTQFYRGTGGLIYCRVIDPKGFSQWLQQLRVLPEKGVGTNE